MDPTGKPVAGRWYWKEDTQTLELSSNNAAAADARERVRKGRTIQFTDTGNRPPARAPSHYLRTAAGTKSPERTFPDPILRSPRHAGKTERDRVTLEDVKNVALNLLQEEERHCIESFSAAVRTRQLDDFLVALLCYLSCFLEKHYLERKPKSLVPKPSILEQKEMMDALTRTDLALKHFARIYCVLVLGEGATHRHHMACGKSKASTTKRDRVFYECLYSFCIYVAWVAFRRKELSLIQEEVGRLLRSNTFNPALRIKHAPEEPARNLSVDRKKPRKSATYAVNRRENPRPSAIKSIITQRSPVLVSLMPSPKERAQYLFRQHELHPSGRFALADIGTWLETSPGLIPPRIGILGEPLKYFNPHSLIPLGAEEEEEEDPGTRGKSSSGSFHTRGLSSRPGTGRRSTVISRATTVATYSDTDDDDQPGT
ncbi:protein phosphatase 1 regulatory subunit 36 [Spea bombifrons]|uniref:protein phosphatase 1 regulatory subunit 36 n=1 Tax=Spea bombifrons TaxID=233779 RepID=UPI00234B7495|nr:protein phosphatase 1 regulatory subunit 36 [Spea bombifrons]